MPLRFLCLLVILVTMIVGQNDLFADEGSPLAPFRQRMNKTILVQTPSFGVFRETNNEQFDKAIESYKRFLDSIVSGKVEVDRFGNPSVYQVNIRLKQVLLIATNDSDHRRRYVMNWISEAGDLNQAILFTFNELSQAVAAKKLDSGAQISFKEQLDQSMVTLSKLLEGSTLSIDELRGLHGFIKAYS